MQDFLLEFSGRKTSRFRLEKNSVISQRNLHIEEKTFLERESKENSICMN